MLSPSKGKVHLLMLRSCKTFCMQNWFQEELHIVRLRTGPLITYLQIASYNLILPSHFLWHCLSLQLASNPSSPLLCSKHQIRIFCYISQKSFSN